MAPIALYIFKAFDINRKNGKSYLETKDLSLEVKTKENMERNYED